MRRYRKNTYSELRTWAATLCLTALLYDASKPLLQSLCTDPFSLFFTLFVIFTLIFCRCTSKCLCNKFCASETCPGQFHQFSVTTFILYMRLVFDYDISALPPREHFAFGVSQNHSDCCHLLSATALFLSSHTLSLHLICETTQLCFLSGLNPCKWCRHTLNPSSLSNFINCCLIRDHLLCIKAYLKSLKKSTSKSWDGSLAPPCGPLISFPLILLSVPHTDKKKTVHAIKCNCN